jgi:hypothetical protein
MSAWSNERKPAAGGILAMILFVVGYFIPGAPPKLGAPSRSVVSYFDGHHRTILIGLILTGIAIPLYVWFLANLTVRLREGGHASLGLSIGLAGGLVAAVLCVADAMTAATAQGEQVGIDGKALRGMYQVSTFTYGRLCFPAIAVGIGVALVAARGGLSGWLKWLGWLQALLALLGGVSLKNSGFFSPTGAMPLIAYIAFFVVTGLTAWSLWSSTTTTSTSTATT